MNRIWNICKKCPQVHIARTGLRMHCEMVNERHFFNKTFFEHSLVPDNCYLKLEYAVLKDVKIYGDEDDKINRQFALSSKRQT